MFRRLWQNTMIAMARSERIKHFMQHARSTSFLRSQFVAGPTIKNGTDNALKRLEEHGIRSSLFYMGEYVSDHKLIDENIRQKIGAIESLQALGLDVHVSADPTQIGHHVNPDGVPANARKIIENITQASAGSNAVHCLMLDMEDDSLVEPTIKLHNALQDDGLPVALTVQAYLRRSYDDMAEQVERGSRVRLVKGAFAAGPELAYSTQPQIKEHSRKIISLMLSERARETGFYPSIATHDTQLHAFAITTARRNGWRPGDYEFEMLMGVREDVACALAAAGERVRIYVPFGQDWWPHAVRRIGENPANALLLARSLVQ